MTDQADETIVLRYLVDAKDAIERSKAFRAEVNAIKAQLKELAVTSNATYKDMAKGMTEAFSTQKFAQLRQWMEQNPLMDSATIKAEIAKTKAEISSYTTAVRTALTEINSEVKSSSKIWSDAERVKAQASRKAAQEIKAAEKESRSAKQQTSSFLASFAGTAAAVVGLTSLVGILQKVTGYLKEAAQAGKEFAQATFSMVVGVRALQRAGVDITIADINKQILALKKDFGIFATKDLVVGTAAFLNLNRDMGFTKEQLFELQDAIATLAVVNGRSMDEVQRTVALALSSGYTEGLQRLGVSINRVTIAQEAARLGWDGGYTSLNEQQRALATYNLVLKKTNVYQDDLLEYQKSLPGQIDSTTAALEDQKNLIGEQLLPVWLQFLNVILDVTTALNKAGVFRSAAVDQTKFVEAYISELEERRGGEPLTNDQAVRANRLAMEEYQAILNELAATGETKTIDEIIADRFGTGLGDVPVAGSSQDEMLASIQASVEDHYDEIQEIQEDYERDSAEAMEDYLRDMEELRIEHDRRMEELELDHNRRIEELRIDHLRRLADLQLEYDRKVDDINLEYERKALDLEEDLANDIAKVWADYYNKLASSEADYRNRQIDAEVKYQETLLRLREGFLLDLEDALQERDARQVLKLIRRYNLEKDQADRAFDQEMDRLRREHEERLSELARQRDERLRQLYEEIEAKRIALEIAHQRELADAELRHQQDLEDEERRFQEERNDEARRFIQRQLDEARRFNLAQTDRIARYRMEMEDLERHLQERYDEIAAALIEEVAITEENMELVRQALNDTLGPGGEADAIYGYYTQRAIAAMQAAAGAIAYITALESLPHGSPWWNWEGTSSIPEGGGGGAQPTALRMAEGGIAVADRATDVTFGEAGPELAAFVPLKDIGSIPDALSALSSGLGMPASSNGSVRIELWLDRYLEGRIVDTAIDNVADIVLRRFRQ